MGLKLEVNNLGFDSLIPSLEANRINIIMSDMLDTPARQKKVDFVDHIMSGSAMMQKAGSDKKITSLDDACGLKASALRGSMESLSISKQSEKCVAEGKPAHRCTALPRHRCADHGPYEQSHRCRDSSPEVVILDALWRCLVTYCTGSGCSSPSSPDVLIADRKVMAPSVPIFSGESKGSSFSILLKKRFATSRSRLAVSKKSTGFPRLSIARYK